MIEQMNDKVFNEIRETIGVEYLKKLHEQNRFLDLLAVFGLPALFFLNMYFLANHSFSFIWFVAFVLQGFTLQILGLAAHELFTHRKVLGEKWSYRVSFLYFFLVSLLPSKYYFNHINHHRRLNTNADSEHYKQDINNRWKRLLLLTFPGVLLAISGKFRSKNADSVNVIEKPVQGSALDKRIIFEGKLLIGYGIVIAILAILFPNYFFWGYLGAFFISFPIAFSLRLILEHSDVDTNNPLQIGTNYRTSALTRFLFFFDSGDCHVIHHVFPKLPFYNIHKASVALRPILEKYQVREHRHLWKLLWGYYVLNLPHRSAWKAIM